ETHLLADERLEQFRLAAHVDLAARLLALLLHLQVVGVEAADADHAVTLLDEVQHADEGLLRLRALLVPPLRGEQLALGRLLLRAGGDGQRQQDHPHREPRDSDHVVPPVLSGAGVEAYCRGRAARRREARERSAAMLDLASVRRQFPALERVVAGRPAVYL